jgi:hypothetical protein
MDTSKDFGKLLENHSDSVSIISDNDGDVNQHLQDRKRDLKTILLYKFVGAILILLLITTNLGWYWGCHRLSHDKLVQGSTKLTYCM